MNMAKKFVMDIVEVSKQTQHRLSLPTPIFFKKLRKFFMWWVGFASAYLITDTYMKLPTPEIVLTIIKYTIAIFGAGIGGASLPTTHPEVDNK